MTTQNTQFEHSDVNADAVGHSVDPETQVDPTTGVASPVEASAQSEPSSPDLAAPDVAAHSEVTTEVTDAQGDAPEHDAQEANIPTESAHAQETTNEPQATTAAEPESEPAPEIVESEEAPLLVAEQVAPEFTPVVEELLDAPSSSQVVPLVAQEEEIQPFTAFIEEFRQSEFRRGTEEPFTPFTPTASDFAPAGERVVTDDVLPSLDFAAPQAEQAAEIVPETPAAFEQEETVIKGDEISETQPASTTPQPATERPVSPLLRPASRLRIPRHGARHREEPAAETPATPAPEAEATTETPRPARRYRFDRPSTKNGATTPPAQPATPSGSLLSPTQPAASPRQEEPKEKDGTGRANAATRSENGHGNETQTKQPAAEVQPAVQEPASPDVASPAAPVAQPTQPEHGRRRHSQQERQREKEQHAAAASAQAAAEIVVPPTQVVETPQEEIAPEDLPPLEYSELQKASTRRRRRHRSGTGSATAPAPTTNAAAPQALTRPAVAEVPAAQAPAPLAPAPAQDPAARVPNTPAAASNQFTIVSGYTVNQMNQGNELSGPFMGPEPSPARGSLLSRDMRSVRAEVQRAPAYTTRSAENVHSTASINQLANVVAQAIQTQTDRMVAELRRANQAPTNVSVTLPPFPSTERVGVFVDVANLLYSARTLRIAVDFGKLLDFLRGNRRLVRAHAYCPTSPQPGDEQMFLQAVKGLGYRITTKNYKTFSSGAKKADLDLDLCMDVVRLVDGRAVDCIVLVSGDSDFMPMLDYCSEHGVRVEVAAFDEAMSQTLRQSCDLFVNLSMLEEIRV